MLDGHRHLVPTIPTRSIQLPAFDPPPDFLVLACFVTVLCALFNVLSLTFGITATVLAYMVSLSLLS